jgi:hypothetical protein
MNIRQKAGTIALSRLVNRLDLHVQGCIEATDENHEAYHRKGIQALEENLLQLFKTYLNVRKVFEDYSSNTPFKRLSTYQSIRPTCSPAQFPMRLNDWLENTLLQRGEYREDRYGKPTTPQPASKFPSIARNASWHSLLNKLEIPSEEIASLAVKLYWMGGSRGGKIMLTLNTATLLLKKEERQLPLPKDHTREKNPLVDPTRNAYTVSVTLDEDSLRSNQVVMRLVMTAPTAKAGDLELAHVDDLIKLATQPTLVLGADTPEKLAKRLYKTLLSSVAKRENALIEEQQRAASDVKKAQAIEVVNALKGLDRKLLQALKENPLLLNEL